MILNHSCKKAFIHIPKCAGTSVRKRLERFDESKGDYTGRVDVHSELGVIDYVHIPLFILREHFQSVHSMLMEYDNFAIVRDPVSRFRSSVFQHVRRYSPNSYGAINLREVINIIEFLDGHERVSRFLPYQYIHFQRQSDYVYDLGVKVVRNIYPIEKVDKMVSDFLLGLHSVEEFSEVAKVRGRSNESRVYKNSVLKTIGEFGKFLVNPFFSRDSKRILKERFGGLFLAPRDTVDSKIYEHEEVVSFLNRYYSEDIELYKSL